MRTLKVLLNEENNTVLDDVPPVEGPIEGFTLEEVKEAVKSLKCGKASGPTGVTGDMLKLAGESAVKELHGVFQRVMRMEVCPEQWRKQSDSSTVQRERRSAAVQYVQRSAAARARHEGVREDSGQTIEKVGYHRRLSV